MADHIYEGGRHVGYVKDGFAFDSQNRKRYRVDGNNLINIDSGAIAGHLVHAGDPNVVSKSGLFD